MSIQAVIVALIFVFCNGCTKWDIELFAGYKLSRLEYKSSSEYFIENLSGSLWIPLNIVGLAISGGFIVGKCEQGHPPTGFPEDVKAGSVPGYFWLNCKTGEKAIGLTESEWIKALHRFEIPRPPRLQRPKEFYSKKWL